MFFSQNGIGKLACAQELTKEIPNVHIVKVKGNDQGMGGHSNAAAHVRYTESVLTAIRPIMAALD